jgi:hypothetical protein
MVQREGWHARSGDAIIWRIQLPEPLTAIVTDNPKRVIYWNDRYNAIPEIDKEVGFLTLYDCRAYLSTKDQRISNPQSSRVRDHYQREIACPRSNGSSSFHMVTNWSL